LSCWLGLCLVPLLFPLEKRFKNNLIKNKTNNLKLFKTKINPINQQQKKRFLPSYDGNISKKKIILYLFQKVNSKFIVMFLCIYVHFNQHFTFLLQSNLFIVCVIRVLPSPNVASISQQFMKF